MKKLTLGLCLMTSTALAHNVEYKVCKGDTLQSISAKFHISGKAILHANDLPPSHHMRAGHYLLIPNVKEKVPVPVKIAKKSLSSSYRHSATALPSHSSKTITYVVRNGDQDWALAKKNGVGLHTLHVLNPNVDWDHLKIGLKIQLPRAGSAPTHRSGVASHSAPKSGVHMAAHWHTVEEGENDWIIAHKAGIRLPLLKSLNPEKNVSNLHPGDKVRVPGSSVAHMALQVHRIHSSHVAINGDNVTIRRSPSTDGESVCTVDEGLHAGVLDRRGAWYQLKFPKGTIGWVRGDLIRPIHEVDRVAVRHTRRHATYVAHVETHHSSRHASRHHSEVVLRSYRHHRSEAGSSSPYREAASNLDSSADADTVLQDARSMRGTRYRWGAASRGGTDCSGFTMQVLGRHGVHLPRVSGQQATVGEHVDYNDLKPGDLVFFHTTRGRRVSHVGIYEGNRKFIHASSGGGHVQENSLDDPYYSRRIVAARRVLKHHHSESKHESGEPHRESSSKTSDPAPKPDPASSTDDGSAAVSAR